MNKHDDVNLDENLDDAADSSSNAAPASLSPLFGTARQVMEKYCHCAQCGGHLHFTHLTDFSRNLTQESAKCPECGIRSQQIIYRLQ